MICDVCCNSKCVHVGPSWMNIVCKNYKESTMNNKVIYKHSEGQYVIWGKEEYFEPSHLVRKHWAVPYADEKFCRHIVGEYNNLWNAFRESEEMSNVAVGKSIRSIEALSDIKKSLRKLMKERVFLRKKDLKHILDVCDGYVQV